jgi:hypothetical protein
MNEGYFRSHFHWIEPMPCTQELFGLLRLVSVGLAYLTGSPDHPSRERNLDQGWQELSPCAETTSFDGAWTLSLSENGTAILNSDRHAQRLQGHWYLLNTETRSYRVDVLAFGNDFVVVPTAAGCVLGSGLLSRIDMRQSWFAHGKHDGGDHVASAASSRVATK